MTKLRVWSNVCIVVIKCGYCRMFISDLYKVYKVIRWIPTVKLYSNCILCSHSLRAYVHVLKTSSLNTRYLYHCTRKRYCTVHVISLYTSIFFMNTSHIHPDVTFNHVMTSHHINAFQAPVTTPTDPSVTYTVSRWSTLSTIWRHVSAPRCCQLSTCWRTWRSTRRAWRSGWSLRRSFGRVWLRIRRCFWGYSWSGWRTGKNRLMLKFG